MFYIKVRSGIKAITTVVLIAVIIGVDLEGPFPTVLCKRFSCYFPGAPHLRNAYKARYGL